MQQLRKDYDSFWFIFKAANNNWDICTNPKFVARNYCRAIYKYKVRDFKQLRYFCKKLNSYQDTLVQRYLIKELEIE